MFKKIATQSYFSITLKIISVHVCYVYLAGQKITRITYNNQHKQCNRVTSHQPTITLCLKITCDSREL